MNETSMYDWHLKKQYWRDRLGIHLGMTKRETLDKFIEWRANKKTCVRCEGNEYIEYCPIHLICEEADNVTGDDNGRRIVQANEPKTIRTGLFEERKRASSR